MSGIIEGKNILLYPHGGSGNHGCEALVRSTIELFPGNKFILSSKDLSQDIYYGLDSICEIIPERNPKKMSLTAYAFAKVKYLSGLDKDSFEKHTYAQLLSVAGKCDFALSIGGDNYCYGVPGYLYVINRLLDGVGLPRILWGCSINPELINEQMLSDLRGYRHIFARESITAEALHKAGLVSVSMLPDPAFSLNAIRPSLPDNFIIGNTVGINISPMIQSYEKESGLLEQCYTELISFILNQTTMNVALIPHVVWDDSDDRIPLTLLYNKFKDSSRICMLSDMPCELIKGAISECRFVITARTHASIASYSSCIPTIVVGYSVKADGISKDLFGTTDKFVIPASKITSEQSLIDPFRWLLDNEESIRQTLCLKTKNYKESLFGVKNNIGCFFPEY